MIIAISAVDKLWIRGHGVKTIGKPTEMLSAMLSIKKAGTKARLMRAVKSLSASKMLIGTNQHTSRYLFLKRQSASLPKA